MTDLATRLRNFYEDLGAFGPADHASWQLGQIFNALLEEVKAAHSEDRVVGAIQPAEESAMGGMATANIGTLRTATGQLITVVQGA